MNKENIIDIMSHAISHIGYKITDEEYSELIAKAMETIGSQEENDWISVNERLPNNKEIEENNGEFLVMCKDYYNDDRGNWVEQCSFDHLADGYMNPKWTTGSAVTAWKPLPKSLGKIKENNWRLVSEELPQNDGYYWLTVSLYGGRKTISAYFQSNLSVFICDGKPIAWKVQEETPEPYEEDLKNVTL